MDISSSGETLTPVHIYKSIRRYDPEDGYFRSKTTSVPSKAANKIENNFFS